MYGSEESLPKFESIINQNQLFYIKKLKYGQIEKPPPFLMSIKNT